MKNIFLIIFALGLSACNHTINLRANHFAVPVVGDTQWSGHMAGVGTSATNITVINDISTNPPTRSAVEVNKDISAADVLLLNNIGFDASISVVNSLELFIDSSLYGVRWQFLNHGPTTDVWAAAIHGAYGSRKHSNSTTSGGVTSGAESTTTTTQAGISLGYKFGTVVPYVSYIHENHQASTTVTNASGTFGAYTDQGTHQYHSIGVSKVGKGFLFALEYSMININWDRATAAYQNAAGGKIGYSW